MLVVGCAGVPVKKELTYLEKMRKLKLDRVYLHIDNDKNLNNKDKKIAKKFSACLLELIQNPHTVSNLMKWQRSLIISASSEICSNMINKTEE